MRHIDSNDLLHLFWNSPEDFYFKAMPFKFNSVSFIKYKVRKRKENHFISCCLDLYPKMQKTYSMDSYISKKFHIEREFYIYDSKEEMIRDKAMTAVSA